MTLYDKNIIYLFIIKGDHVKCTPFEWNFTFQRSDKEK